MNECKDLEEFSPSLKSNVKINGLWTETGIEYLQALWRLYFHFHLSGPNTMISAMM